MPPARRRAVRLTPPEALAAWSAAQDVLAAVQQSRYDNFKTAIAVYDAVGDIGRDGLARAAQEYSDARAVYVHGADAWAVRDAGREVDAAHAAAVAAYERTEAPALAERFAELTPTRRGDAVEIEAALAKPQVAVPAVTPYRPRRKRA